MIAVEIIAAYFLADAISGAYHWATDSGMNFRSQIEMFQEHHKTNTMDGFDWQTFAVGMPLAIVGAWLHSACVVALGCFIALTQVTHYYAHRRSSVPLVHHFIRVLQLSGLIVHPASHQRHHSDGFDRNFCLLSGWNNWWMNRLASAIGGRK